MDKPSIQEPGTYFPQVPSVPFRGDTPEEVEAHLAFEAQLRHTANLINQSLTEHAHFTDDCGDYLSATADLTSALVGARMDGPASLLARFHELIKPEDGEFSLIYPSDGIADEVVQWAEAHGANFD